MANVALLLALLNPTTAFLFSPPASSSSFASRTRVFESKDDLAVLAGELNPVVGFSYIGTRSVV